jgi:hypothetical protein
MTADRRKGSVVRNAFRKKRIKKKMAEKFGYLRGKEYLCKPIIISLWIKG